MSVRFSGQLDHVGTGGRNDTVDSSEGEEDGVGDAVGMEDAVGVENAVGVKVVNLGLEDWNLGVAGRGVAVEGIEDWNLAG